MKTQHENAVPNWADLSFSLTKTDYMYSSIGDLSKEQVWDSGEFIPFEDIRISPAAAFMSYGMGIFEGLKAHRLSDKQAILFRPDANAARFQKSAERLMMAEFPVGQFVDASVEVVQRNARFIPPTEFGSLYLRPTQHAIEPQLGLGPCSVFRVLIFASPVGTYFKGGAPKGVHLRVLEQGRCAPGGTGYAKAMGNYAGAIYVASKWREQGYDDVLYLDAHHVKYLTETSGSNPFVVLRSGTIVTPPLDDQILPGITRGSTIELARSLGHTVEERALSIDEVIEEGAEMFCTGTAWTLQSVRQIDHGETTKSFESEDVRKQLLDELKGIQLGERPDKHGWTVVVDL